MNTETVSVPITLFEQSCLGDYIASVSQRMEEQIHAESLDSHADNEKKGGSIECSHWAIRGETMPISEDTKEPAFKESWLRSLVKSLIYRIVSIAGTAILAWVITKDVRETISITIVIQVFLVILYYCYERVWNRIDWGRTMKPT